MNMLIHERPMVVLPSLAAKVGLHEAMLLQYISDCGHYGSDTKVIGGRTWVRLSQKELAQGFPFWTRRTVERLLKRLRQRGLIDAVKGVDDTGLLWYTVRTDKLSEA